MYGPGCPPSRGREGEPKFGLTIGERVLVLEGSFKDWYGHVLAFGKESVAVELDEPPPGDSPNGQYFHPDKIQSAPA